MPAKRSFEERQQAPPSHVDGHGTLRPLLPKKGWQPLKRPIPLRSDRHVRVNGARKVKACRVPACKLPNCNLRTHQQYGRKSTASLGSSSATSTSSDLNHELSADTDDSSEHDTQFAVWNASLKLPRNAVHGLEQLPDSLGETPVFRTLFHEFFSRVYDRILLLLSPPPVDRLTKQACFALAMTSPAYCLNAIASVEIRAILERKPTDRDQTITVLYGKVMSILRAQVKQIETAEIDNLLMIICTLAIFDVVHYNFSALPVHQRGMVQLVNRVGGVHNLTISLPIVLHLDRIFATFTGQLPTYARLIDRSIQKPSKYAEVYAGFFDDDGKTCIDQEVCTFCCDVSRVLELFEGAKISFDPATADTIADPDVLYFYFSRQRVADHFTFLNHKYWTLHVRSRCVLLATKILDYTIILDNYISVTPDFLAEKVKETLDTLEVDAPETWKGHEDMLIWILFVIVTMPQPRITYGWAFATLRELLISKYDSFAGSLNWKEEELQSMKRFVWCSSRLDEIFLESCHELECSVSHVDGVAHDFGIVEMLDASSDRDGK